MPSRTRQFLRTTGQGGAVEAEVEVGGDRHQQRALVAVQVLYGAVLYDL